MKVAQTFEVHSMWVISRFLLFVLSACSLLVSLHIADGIVYQLSPHSRLPLNGYHHGGLYTWGHLVRQNSFGFRDKEFSQYLGSDWFRIVVLGDSLTWGAGLSEEQRYTNILEETFESKQIGGRKVVVFNLALSGAPLTRSRDVFREFAKRLKPDLVVVGFCINDPQPRGQDYSIEYEIISEKFSFYFDSMRILSVHFPYLGRTIVEASRQVLESIGAIPDWRVALGRTYELTSKEWLGFVNGLQDIRAQAEVLTNHPPIFMSLYQGYSSIPTSYSAPDENIALFLKWYRQAEMAAASAGFVTANPKNEFLEHLDGTIIGVNEIDGHPSASANFYYASALQTVIACIITSTEPVSCSRPLSESP